MAKRDKLTHRQKRQVAQQHHQRIKTKDAASELGDLSSPKDGLLISRYGEQADVHDVKNHTTHRCYLRQNLGSPVTGDFVSFRLDPNNQGVIEAIHPRDTVIHRPSAHQGLKPIVANIDQVFIVVAPLPDFSATLLDRYLVALTEADANITIHVVANKWDLSNEIQRQSIDKQLEIYGQLGYPIIRVSTKTDLGLETLESQLIGHRSILVGQSGVGKSSIINRLFPKQLSAVKIVSENSRLGQHTTTASQLFFFEDSDGFIVDSPGIREFGLWHLDKDKIANGFIEFTPYIGCCKFRDCQHSNEPGCALIQAVKNEDISQQRWQSYNKIVQSIEPD